MQLGIQMWKLFLDGSSDRIRERLSERISPCNRKSSPVLQTRRSPSMRLNSLSLLVTRLTPQDMACAPVSMSIFSIRTCRTISYRMIRSDLGWIRS